MVVIGRRTDWRFTIDVIYLCRDRLVARYSADGTAGKSFVFTGATVGGLLSPPLLGVVIDASSPTVVSALVRLAFAVAAGIVLFVSLELAHLRARVASRSD